jgi:hypothetical protein
LQNVLADSLKDLFKAEFVFVEDKFEIIQFPICNKPTDIPNIYKPGVYLIIQGERVWKVGKSFDNSSKRAYKHFSSDTGANIGKGMKKYLSDETFQLVLFNLKKKEDLHWVIALETFFELKLRSMDILEIRAGRIG